MRFLLLFTGLSICFALGAQQPGHFVENRGQWPEEVLFGTSVENGKVYFQETGLRVHLYDASAVAENHLTGQQAIPGTVRFKGHVYDVRFDGAFAQAPRRAEGAQPTHYNYFLGNDPSNWASGCRSFSGFFREDLYDGIDLHVYSNGPFLKYDFIVRAAADASQIRMTYTGADRIVLEHGRIKVVTGIGEVWEQKPVAWQMDGDEKIPVPCEYILEGQTVRFGFPKGYRPDIDLIIDPELVFSTYSGSFDNNFGYTATYDSQGYLYSGSSAFGQGYPTTTGAYQTVWGGGDGSFGLAGTDMALSKYDVSGTFMVWSSFLGGENDELPHSLICNEQDELIVYGTTSSPNFPVTAGAYDTVFNGGTAFSPQGVGTDYVNGSDIVVSRFNATGSDLVGSTFVGGTANDGVNTATTLKFNYADEFRGEIDLADNGDVLIASSTFSSGFPIINGFQTAIGGAQDAVIFRLNPELTDLIWSSFLGGANDDSGYSASFDASGNVYFCGGTKSTDFPTTNGVLWEDTQGGSADGWIAHISSNGNDLLASSYFGSSSYDQLYFVETDSEDQVHVYGQSNAPDNTWVINADWSEPNSGMVVAKITPDLEDITWSTVFGSGDGEPNLSPAAFLVDLCGKIYLSGWGGTVNTSSNPLTDDTNNMTVTPDAYQSTTNGSDFYLLVMEADASDIVYGSYFGGNISAEHVDGGTSRFDRKGIIYQSVCAGCGGNDDFPIYPSNAVSAVNNNSCNNGVFKFDFQLPLTVADFNVPPVGCVNQPIPFTSTSTFAQTFFWDFDDGTTANTANPVHIFEDEGTYNVMLLVTHPGTCNVVDSVFRTITIGTPEVSDLGEIALCEGESAIIGPDDPDPTYVYTWEPTLFLDDPSDPNPLYTAGSSVDYVLLAEHAGCVDTFFVSVDVTELSLTVPSDTTLCDDLPLELTAIVSPSTADIIWSDQPDFTPAINDGPDDPDISVLPDVPTTYYVQVTEGNCVREDEVFVNLVSFQTQVVGDFNACAGDVVTLSVLDPNPEFNYSWAPEDIIISGQNTPSVDVLIEAETTITVFSETPDGCTASDEVTVYVSDLSGQTITATAVPSVIVEGQSSQLNVQPSGYDYTWTPATWLNSGIIQNPLSTPSETITYTVTVSDDECSGTAQVTVRVVDFVCGPPSIYVPNSFTPNEDNRNEWLYVRANNVNEVLFRVYDRWGELVWETTELDRGWDGRFRDRACDPDVYVYYLEATCDGGQTYFEEGNITLIR